MNKKIIVIIIVTILASCLYAGPFGLQKGMSLEQVKTVCGGREPTFIKDDVYFIKPIKQHPDFIEYIVFIDNEEGLYYVKALSKKIRTDKYGIEIRNMFNSIRQTLTHKYGNSELIDYLMSDSHWDEASDWMYSLSQDERYYFSYWDKEKSFNLTEEIECISMQIKAESSYFGYIVLEYEFSNSSIVNQNQEEEKASIL